MYLAVFFIVILQVKLDVHRVISVLLLVIISMKDVLSSAITISGGLSVMILMIDEMFLSFVVS